MSNDDFVNECVYNNTISSLLQKHVMKIGYKFIDFFINFQLQ